jgi:outer membrane protein assembly factor BamA
MNRHIGACENACKLGSFSHRNRLYTVLLATYSFVVTFIHPSLTEAQTESTETETVSANPAPTNASTYELVPAILPAYQPETSFMIGGAAILAQKHPEHSPRRESQLLFAGAASVRKQYSLLLQPDLYFAEDQYQLGGQLSASHFPDFFYGIGNHTRNEDKEAYTPNQFEVELSPKLRILRGFYLGPNVRILHTNIVKRTSQGELATSDIKGAHGGTSFELGLMSFWDTRDRTLYPSRGGLLRLRLVTSRKSLGSDFEYDVARLDGRYYVTLPWLSHILAVEQVIEARRGEPPFYSLARLGGSEILRGYFEGKYRDRQYVATQIEYRLPLFHRLGAVAFVSTGAVAHSWRNFRPSDWKVSEGGGLRFAPLADVPVNIRLDIAYGDDINFYFGIGEAF